MSFFKPNEYVSSVVAIDPEALRARGFETILLDLDNTLLPRYTAHIPETHAAWIARVKQAGFKVCLLSNSWQEVSLEHARHLDLPIVYKSMKPFPFAFSAALSKVGGARATAVCIGDQLITDVWGGHISRMPVILVPPLVDRDLPHTRLLRKVERPFMKDLSPQPCLGALRVRTQEHVCQTAGENMSLEADGDALCQETSREDVDEGARS